LSMFRHAVSFCHPQARSSHGGAKDRPCVGRCNCRSFRVVLGCRYVMNLLPRR
jgi:hypothetical protein